MKQIFPLLIIIFAACLFSCTEKDISLTLDTNSVNMEFKNYYQLIANVTEAKYYSEDEYHATVDENGLITANRIGNTNIVVSSSKGSAKVKVIVRPCYNLYPEPCRDWTKTKSQIISQYGTPSSETSSGISYLTDSKIYPLIIYEFDQNNILKESSVTVNESYASTLAKFLEERYAYSGIFSQTYIFYNEIKKESITMSVLLSKISGYKLYLVRYVPYSATKSDLPDSQGNSLGDVSCLNPTYNNKIERFSSNQRK